MSEQQGEAGFWTRLQARWKAVPVETKTRVRWLGWGALAMLVGIVIFWIAF